MNSFIGFIYITCLGLNEYECIWWLVLKKKNTCKNLNTEIQLQLIKRIRENQNS